MDDPQLSGGVHNLSLLPGGSWFSEAGVREAAGATSSALLGSGPGGGKSVVVRLAIEWWILGVGMLLALYMGILGGVLPALSAMRTRPLQALR